MLRISDAIRPYWAFGINNITFQKSIYFSKWVEQGNDYRVEKQLEVDRFEIFAHDRERLLGTVSSDCNRFGIAAFESVIKAENSQILPKSISWLIVKLYYAAFYSGHLLLRLLGVSLSQLDKNTTLSVEKVAQLYSFKNGITLNKGFFLCDYTDRTGIVVFSKAIKSGEDGSHGILWKNLHQKLSFISNDILLKNSSTDYQPISLKIKECLDNMDYMHSNHDWLSRIRNDINYRHLHSTWYPYSNYPKYYSGISGYLDNWKGNPIDIELRNYTGKEILRFIATCQFIIGTTREVCEDMNVRCSDGKSFLHFGPLALLNHQKLTK